MEETENDDQLENVLTELKVESQTDRYSPLVDMVTVDRGTRSIIHKGSTITVASTEKEKRNAQIEAAIEIIMKVKNANKQRLLSRATGEQQPASNVNSSCGLVLNSEMISLGGDRVEHADGFIKVGRVLGKGNSAGEVIVVKDKVTEKEMAYKTILVSHFNDDEIRAWIRLGDEDMAPKLYHFRLIDGNVEFTMEPLTGLTLEQVTDHWACLYKQDPSFTEKLSLCVLDDLLEIHDKLQPFSHGDVHAGNVFLENSMAVKLIDFGRARNMIQLISHDRGQTMKNNLVGIIRIFCALYSGVDFNDLFDAKTQLAANDLSQLSENMCHIPEASRKDLFTIMSMLYDTVRDTNPDQQGFGDTSLVAAHIKSLLPEDIDTFKKKVAVILFPERYQVQALYSHIDSHKNRKNMSLRVFTCVDGVDSQNDQLDCDEVDGYDSGSASFTWDSPYMADCVSNVTLKDLQILDAKSLFF